MNYKDELKNTLIFKELTDPDIEEILDSYRFEPTALQRGEALDFSYGGELALVISGRLDVIRERPDNTPVVLNRLSAGSVFGLLSVFSEEQYPTKIVASLNSRLLSLKKQDVLSLVEKYPKIAKNIIYFMADRISFLNRKIATFSLTRVDERLFSYLLNVYKESGKKSFPLNCKKCSEAINAGRASVYRAIELLASEGVISFENKFITIIKTERKQ